MNVSEQCGIAASKGNQILGLIRRNITYKKSQRIGLLYSSGTWEEPEPRVTNSPDVINSYQQLDVIIVSS